MSAAPPPARSGTSDATGQRERWRLPSYADQTRCSVPMQRERERTAVRRNSRPRGHDHIRIMNSPFGRQPRTRPGRESNRSREQRLHDRTMHIRESIVAALELVGEPFMIDAQLVQKGRVEIVDAD